MSMPPAGPPPGYQGPQGPPPPPGGGSHGYGDPTMAFSRQLQRNGTAPNGAPAPKPAGSRAVLVLGIIAVAAVVLGLTLKEDGHNAWDSVNAWGALAIVAAAATLAPALGRGIGLGSQRAWQVALCGAGALLLFWVLLVLPRVGSNTSLLTTIGVAAGVVAAWVAPGRPEPAGDRPQASSW
jgi:hypothetical protein